MLVDICLGVEPAKFHSPLRARLEAYALAFLIIFTLGREGLLINDGGHFCTKDFDDSQEALVSAGVQADKMAAQWPFVCDFINNHLGVHFLSATATAGRRRYPNMMAARGIMRLDDIDIVSEAVARHHARLSIHGAPPSSWKSYSPTECNYKPSYSHERAIKAGAALSLIGMLGSEIGLFPATRHLCPQKYVDDLYHE